MTDRRSSTKIRSMILHSISNIIEDAFIEGVGATVFPQTEFYLRWGRAARIFVTKPSKGTLTRNFEKSGIDTETKTNVSADTLAEVLEYMVTELLYPFVEQQKPSEEALPYITAVRPHYLNGSLCPKSEERFAEVCKIFDILEPVIDGVDDAADRLDNVLKLAYSRTADEGSEPSEGKAEVPKRRLFTDLDGAPIDFDANAETENIRDLSAAERDDMTDADTVRYINAGSVGAAKLHTGISIKEVHPAPDKAMNKAYKNILKNHALTISTYNSRFVQLLSADRRVIEKGRLFGKGIVSSCLADPKKRWWYTEKYTEDIPDLAVIMLIDGSGSMNGVKRCAAVEACVILDSILTTQGIEHAVVEHRAIIDEPEVVHNVLVDFNSRLSDKVNILRLKADGGSREGLSLYWAAKYIEAHSFAENKLIIAVSDGYPYHYPTYSPPASIKDTANAAKKITASGIKITAIALGGCYEDLNRIYPETIDCDDVNKLAGKLLRVVSRALGG